MSNYWKSALLMLLVEVPLALLVVLPAALVGFVCAHVYAGWLFGLDLFVKAHDFRSASIKRAET